MRNLLLALCCLGIFSCDKGLTPAQQLQEDIGMIQEYLADRSGHVISIATFGDELLCLPEVHSQDNGALMWRIDPTHLPKPGTKVTLRLRFQKAPASKPKP